MGTEGQSKIANIHVGIVGLGGNGSHIVQQLVYLGVKKFTVIDNDFVEITNLNRLIGATSHDLDVPTRKVAVAKRMVHATYPKKCKVNALSDKFPTEASLNALKDIDIIFGCFDSDGPRLILTEFSCAYKKPYIDLATEIHPDDNAFGGRVFFSMPGKSCLYCRGELSVEEIRRDLQTDAEKVEEETIYGVSKSSLNGSGPSVVSLNGIIASMAVTEFVVFITGIRPAKELLIYDGITGIVKSNTDPPSSGCIYCNAIKGIGDKANIERYINKE